MPIVPPVTTQPIIQNDPQAWQAQQQAINRRALMGQALMQQGQQPLQGQMVGNIYVGNSPLQGLANMFRTYEGGKMLHGAEGQSQALELAKQRAMSQALQNLGQPGDFAEQEKTAANLYAMDPQAASMYQSAANNYNNRALQQWMIEHGPSNMKAIIDPKTGQPKYVPGVEAMGQQPFSPFTYVPPLPGGSSNQATPAPSATAKNTSGTDLPAGVNMQALEAVPPQFRNTVAAITDGRMQMPSGYALKTPYWNAIQQYVYRVAPNYDATIYQRRQNTSKAFSSGSQSNAVKSVNQALFHAGTLLQDINNLHNFSGAMTPLNAPVNWVESKFGNPAQGNFVQTRDALANELRKVFAATGGGGLEELKQWQQSMPVNASPEQQKSYLANGMHLLRGALQALNNQYQSGMGSNANIRDLISPDAQHMYDMVMGSGSPKGPQESATQGSKVVDFGSLK